MIFRPKKHRGRNLIGKYVFKKWVGVKPSVFQGLGGLSAIQGLSIRVQGLGFSDFGFKYRFLGFSDFSVRVQGFQGLYRFDLQGLGFRQVLTHRVQGLYRFDLQGLGFRQVFTHRVQGLYRFRFRVQAFRVLGSQGVCRLVTISLPKFLKRGQKGKVTEPLLSPAYPTY